MGVRTMKIISHFPKSANAQKALSNNLTEVYAKIAIERIQKMNLAEDDTKRLITMICDKAKISADT